MKTLFNLVPDSVSITHIETVNILQPLEITQGKTLS